jgi:uncharacterized protein
VKIELKAIENEPVSFDERIELEPGRLDEGQVAGAVSVHLEGTVRATGGSYRVAGRFSAAGPLACARCLEPVPWQASEEFSVECRPAGTVGDDELELDERELDVAFLDGDVLDLAEVAVEQVMLALPMKVLCDDGCAGLCPQCGANRNQTGACTCGREVDPRWQALDGLVGRDTN